MSARGWTEYSSAKDHYTPAGLHQLVLKLGTKVNSLRQSKPRLAVGALAVCFCFVLLKIASWGPDDEHPYEWTPTTKTTLQSTEPVVLDPSFYVNGSPTTSFRDNLKPGVKYVTTWAGGGLTNEFITWSNLIHLAFLSQRVPVTPPLLPDEEYLGRGGSSLDASDIYDIPRLAKTLNIPILEWSQLKRARYYKSVAVADREPHEDDEVLGCWSAHQEPSEAPGSFDIPTPHFLHLNIQYTASSLNMPAPGNVSTVNPQLTRLVHLLSPSGRASALSISPSTWAEDLLDPVPKPDEQLACFDDLYLTDAAGTEEWEKDVGPTWDLVGTNMHFTRRMDVLVNSLLRNLFDLHQFDVIPPFISVHARRRDIEYFCRGPSSVETCIPPLSAYAKLVDEVRAELRQIHGRDSIFDNVEEVIVTSDETSATWWDEVDRMGWKGTKQFQHELQMTYGVWFPPIVDSVIQSRGAGFVGTSSSQMSIVAAKRVLDWRGGPSRMVNWGGTRE